MKTSTKTFRTSPDNLDFLEQEALEKGIASATHISNIIKEYVQKAKTIKALNSSFTVENNNGKQELPAS